VAVEIRIAGCRAVQNTIINMIASCTLMQQPGERVYFSNGSETNLKITAVDDVLIVKAFLDTKKDIWLK